MLDDYLHNDEITPLTEIRADRIQQNPIFRFSLPFDLIKLGGKDQKIARFEYLKADVVIKLMLNANNMTSGRFWLCYAPIDALVSTGNQLINRHRAGITAYPGVEIDININNAVELVVPYVYWAEAMSITSADPIQGSMATLYLFALTPLRSSNNYPITIQVWGWFDNITLVGPTTLNPDSKAMSASMAVATKLNSLTEEQLYRYKKILTEMQIKTHKRTKHDEVPEGIADETPGPVQQIASTVSTVASAVSGIPIIGEIAGTVGWISDMVGGVASIFGWSKPVDTSENCRFSNVPGFGYSYSEGIDASLVLGASSKNQLEVAHDAFPSGIDEMDIRYVCANPSLVRSGTWDLNTQIGDSITTLLVAPVSDDTLDANGFRYYSTSAVDFVASLFGMWRGTMCYRICVVKTAYHTGRLEICFVPNQFSRVTMDQDTTNTYRYILDITNEAEVVIKIPFFSDAYMLPVGDRFSSLGILQIRSISALVAPSAVNGNVDILVWKWMEDPVFAVPSADDVETYVIDNKERVEMQIMIGNTVSSAKTVTFFPKNNDIGKAKVLGSVCGEVIDNLRYLTRASRYIKTVTIPDGGAIGLSLYDQIQTDYVGFISQMYRYARGGMNYKLFAVGSSVNPLLGLRSRLTFNRGLTERTPTHITYPAINPVHEISIPFYSKYKRIPVINVVGGSTNTTNLGQPLIPSVRIELMNTGEAMQLDVYRATKDDFSFGVLVGPPMFRRKL
ncbi:MAG: structural polyprotein [Corattcep virus 1]|nr:MAG: structural polyprotein [Corattcep virus 1]